MLEDALQPPEDYAALKAWALDKASALEREQAVLETTRRELLQAQTGLVGATLLIEKLKIELARLKRETYGASSEKLARIDQLELQLEDLEETVAAAAPARAEPVLRKPVRRPLPDHLPRHDVVHEPALAANGCSCPGCGGRLSRLGEDATEELEYVPASFRVVRHLRPKYACRACEAVHQAPMPSRPIERGRPGPGLLAQVLVAKYDDHLPLYRQSEIYAREGVELERSTLVDWVGRSAALLKPLADAVGEHVMAASKLHADDTPVPVLEPGRGRTKTGRLWVYVHDDRPCGSDDPPAAFYRYSPALQRIAALYEIEDRARGRPPDERRRLRQAEAAPRLAELHARLDQQRARLRSSSKLAGALRYSLKRWPALTRYADDGRLEIDNNAAERAPIRGPRPQELPLRRLRRRRRARRHRLHTHRDRQALRREPLRLAHQRHRPHRRPPRTQTRRAPALGLGPALSVAITGRLLDSDKRADSSPGVGSCESFWRIDRR